MKSKQHSLSGLFDVCGGLLTFPPKILEVYVGDKNEDLVSMVVLRVYSATNKAMPRTAMAAD